jgi:(p)ppGpp synthase/HD superfamily hydrolase
LAREAHAGQRRKYGGGPYIEHPARVASRVALLDGFGPEAVAAAWLHDVVEDCDWTPQQLREVGFPAETVAIVEELTNVSKQYADLPRKERKRLDRERLSGVSRAAKCIKMIDRIDNLREVQGADAGFRSLYAAESVLLVPCLMDADAELAEELYSAVEALGFSRDHQHE